MLPSTGHILYAATFILHFVVAMTTTCSHIVIIITAISG